MSPPEVVSYGAYSPDQPLAQSPSEIEHDKLLQKIREDRRCNFRRITPEEKASIGQLCTTQELRQLILACDDDHPLPPQIIAIRAFGYFSFTQFNPALARARGVLEPTLFEIKNAGLKGRPAQYYLGRKDEETVKLTTITLPDGRVLHTRAFIAKFMGYPSAENYKFRRDIRPAIKQSNAEGVSLEGSEKEAGFLELDTLNIILQMRFNSSNNVSVLPNDPQITTENSEESDAAKAALEDDPYKRFPSGLVTPENELEPWAYGELKRRLTGMVLSFAIKDMLDKLGSSEQLIKTSMPAANAKDVKKAVAAMVEKYGGYLNLETAILEEGFQERITQGKLDPQRAVSILSDRKKSFSKNPLKKPERIPGNSNREIFPEPAHSSNLRLGDLPGLASALKDPF